MTRCGAPTKAGGRCRKSAMAGTSRCERHQGAWSAYEVVQRKKREARKKKPKRDGRG
ncbi:hypothetical protein GCM10009757_38270 [Streptomyces cheonanensis]|uniref:Uncharacterized protein n=1 Tax=Streptomyces cheonanensis TaxID=312720 RepID=A0ABN2VBL8_9ACTN